MGRLLAAGVNDGQIRVRSLEMGIFISLMPLSLDMGYHHKKNASHAERTRKHSL